MDKSRIRRFFVATAVVLLTAALHCASDSVFIGGLDGPIEELRHRIVFGSCYNPNKGDAIWNFMKSFSPNQLILLGDQIYADFHPVMKYKWFNGSSVEMIETEYKKLYSMPGFLNLVKSLSHGFLSTFDDHDYGKDNGDRTFKYRAEAIELFRKYNRPFHFEDYVFLPDPTSPSQLRKEEKSGVFSSHDYIIEHPSLSVRDSNAPFRYKVILLDGRSNKDVKGTEGGDFLGEQQWRWLEYELSQDRVMDYDLIVIGSGIQMLSDDKLVEESWGEFPEKREKLIQLLSRTAFRTNLFLLSGDIHCAEVSQMRCVSARTKEERRLLEVTSSGLSHTFTKIMDYQRMTADNVASTKIIVKSRSAVAEFFSSIYQVVYPAVYREDKYGDVYQGLHFALLDIVRSTGGGQGGRDQWKVVFQIKNHEGSTVILKEQSLLPVTTTTAESSAADIHCEPIQGPLTAFQFQFFKANMVIGAMIFILLPVGAILWFSCAAIYYIFLGKELERRELIERNYHVHKDSIMKKNN